MKSWKVLLLQWLSGATWNADERQLFKPEVGPVEEWEINLFKDNTALKLFFQMLTITGIFPTYIFKVSEESE